MWEKTRHHNETAWGYLICKAQANRPAEQDWQVCQKTPSNLRGRRRRNPALLQLLPLSRKLGCACWQWELQTWVLPLSPLLLQFCPSCFWGPCRRLNPSHVNTFASKKAKFQASLRAGCRFAVLGAQLSSRHFAAKSDLKSLVASWGIISHSAISGRNDLKSSPEQITTQTLRPCVWRQDFEDSVWKSLIVLLLLVCHTVYFTLHQWCVRLQQVHEVPAGRCLLIGGNRTKKVMEWAFFIILNLKLGQINHEGTFFQQNSTVCTQFHLND